MVPVLITAKSNFLFSRFFDPWKILPFAFKFFIFTCLAMIKG